MKEDELKEIALSIINQVDHDIYKDCLYEIEDEGECSLVKNISDYLISIFNLEERKNDKILK